MVQTRQSNFNSQNVVSLFTVYEFNAWKRDLNADFTAKDCLFGAVKLTKNLDPDKYSSSRYGIGIDSRSLFSLPSFDWVKILLFLE